MGNFEQKNNTGTIFKNDKKKSDNHPDYKGSALIDGVEYWQSVWVKEGRDGKFFSQSFTKKEANPQGTTNKTNAKTTTGTSTSKADSLPF